jgi:hypothetical protein
VHRSERRIGPPLLHEAPANAGFLYWGLQASDAAWYRGGTNLIDGERKSLRYVVMLMADFRFHAEAEASL